MKLAKPGLGLKTMNDIIDISRGSGFIDKTVLGGADYFRAVVYDAVSSGMLSRDAAAGFQMQLWRLLGGQITQYSMGDSSSVRVEFSKELFESICCAIGTYLKQADDPARLITTKSVDSLFRAGQKTLERYVSEGRALLAVLKRNRIYVRNLAYRDTVTKALPLFFSKYDRRFLAHETPCMIDYPLCIPVPEVGGIAYINAYMGRLLIEDAFCRCFDPLMIERLMAGYCQDSAQQLVNIFEPVFFNAVGCGLLGKDIFLLDITDAEKKVLLDRLNGLRVSGMESLVADTVHELCRTLGLRGGKLTDYLGQVQKVLVIRLARQLEHNDLSGLLVSFKEPDLPVSHYDDGIPMPDQALRDLIAEMADCRYVSDKLAMVKRHIHSLRDLIEVLNICFFDNEYEQVFDLLSGAECLAMTGYLRKRKGDLIDDRSQNAAWENAFLDYMKKKRD